MIQEAGSQWDIRALLPYVEFALMFLVTIVVLAIVSAVRRSRKLREIAKREQNK